MRQREKDQSKANDDDARAELHRIQRMTSPLKGVDCMPASIQVAEDKASRKGVGMDVDESSTHMLPRFSSATYHGYSTRSSGAAVRASTKSTSLRRTRSAHSSSSASSSASSARDRRNDYHARMFKQARASRSRRTRMSGDVDQENSRALGNNEQGAVSGVGPLIPPSAMKKGKHESKRSGRAGRSRSRKKVTWDDGGERESDGMAASVVTAPPSSSFASVTSSAFASAGYPQKRKQKQIFGVASRVAMKTNRKGSSMASRRVVRKEEGRRGSMLSIRRTGDR